MLIHHITDLHIPDGDAPSGFEHVKPNVLRQIEFAASNNADLLVVSGDLTIPAASRTACEWLASALPRHVRSIVMAGNHDDPEVLWEVFGPDRCVDHRFFFTFETNDHIYIFLNSSSNFVTEDQLGFLLAQAREKAAILFMHHPPDLVSDGFMSKTQPLKNHKETAEAIRRSSVEHVFCGHYHNAADKLCSGFNLHLTPSPAFQIDLDSEEFKMEPCEPSVRVIEVSSLSVATGLVAI